MTSLHLTPTFIAQLLGMVSLAIVVTNGVVTFGKQLVGLWLSAPGQQTAYKAAVQALALLAGVGSTICLTATFYGPLTPQLCAVAGLFGYAIGLAAMGNYEMLTALIKTVEGIVPAPAPAPATPTPAPVEPVTPPAA